MIRKFKALGLCLVAVCALGMTATSLAGANPTLTTTNGATIIGDESSDAVFTITNSKFWCEEAAYTGTAPAASFTALTVTPEYANCKAKLGGGATVAAEIIGFGAGGCDLTLHSTGSTDIVCAAGKEVTFIAGTCVVHIAAQAGLKNVTYDTGLSPTGIKDMTLTANITKIKENHTDGFLCPFEGTGVTETGVYEGTITLTAFVGGNQVHLTDH